MKIIIILLLLLSVEGSAQVYLVDPPQFIKPEVFKDFPQEEPPRRWERKFKGHSTVFALEGQKIVPVVIKGEDFIIGLDDKESPYLLWMIARYPCTIQKKWETDKARIFEVSFE